MVQPTIEPKFIEYGISNTDSGRPIYDKKSPLPMATKKTVLRDLQNENRITMPNCMESPSFLKKNGPEIEPVKASTPKRTDPEHHVNNTQSINAANGPLVYVRRRPETELPKSNIYVSSKDSSFCSMPRKVGNQHQASEEKLQANESPFCIPEITPMPMSPLKPSVPSSLGKSPHNLQTMAPDTCALSVSLTPSGYPKRMRYQYWEDRYCQLQNLLEMLDRSNQENYVQMLCNLSPEGLSSQAIGLEKRTIQLSLEEAKELQRGQQLDVLGTYAKNSRAPAAQRG